MKKGTITFEEIKVNVLPDGRMDTKNSAIYVGCSIGELASIRYSDKGPDFVKIKSHVFYFRDTLDIWLKDEEGRHEQAKKPRPKFPRIGRSARPVFKPKPKKWRQKRK